MRLVGAQRWPALMIVFALVGVAPTGAGDGTNDGPKPICIDSMDLCTNANDFGGLYNGTISPAMAILKAIDQAIFATCLDSEASIKAVTDVIASWVDHDRKRERWVPVGPIFVHDETVGQNIPSTSMVMAIGLKADRAECGDIYDILNAILCAAIGQCDDE